LQGAVGYDLVQAMQEEGFDPAFTLNAPLGTFLTIPLEFMGYSRDTAFLPMFVNSYVPPQPSPDRCYAFGQALDRALKRLGLRAVIIGSGGLSHYPGTQRYAEPGPDDATDEEIFRKCSEGNVRHLLSYDALALDRSGNVEIRPLLIVAGALGDRRPDVALYEPNWHHNYAVLGWTSLPPSAKEMLYYEATAPERVELSRAVHLLRTSKDACAEFLQDPEGFSRKFDLTEIEKKALLRLDMAQLRDSFGVHPLLSLGAVTQMDIQRRKLSN
jgi:2,3-dihydroxyphenylpropionate 1,2-dioxygenase